MRAAAVERGGAALRAGVGAVALDPPLGLPLMGYGARTGTAERCDDPLFARALYLAGGSDALLVACDLCLIAPAQADAVRARIAARTGLSVERICVTCIHTHSAPDTGLGALLAGREPPEHVAPLLEAAVEAGARAVAAAAPARLGVGRAEARIGRNRAHAEGPLDPEVLVLRVDREDGAPLAVLFVHGCHPTVLGHESLAYSRDWPGAAVDAVESALPGATALFALGAHGDIDPRTRGLQDLGVPGQSAGAGPDAARALGEELGAAVASAARGIETRTDAPVGAASTRVELAALPGGADEASRERALERRRAEAVRALGLPEDAAPRTAELFRLERERTEGLPLAERRERVARVRLYLRDRLAPRFAGGPRAGVEVQLLRLGPARLLCLPLEPTAELGLAWRRSLGGAPGALLGIANGWLRYLPAPERFEEPGAHLRYEILQSTFVPAAAPRLLAAGGELERILDSSLGGPVGGSPGPEAQAASDLRRWNGVS